jgi:hypothetical protein
VTLLWNHIGFLKGYQFEKYGTYGIKTSLSIYEKLDQRPVFGFIKNEMANCEWESGGCIRHNRYLIACRWAAGFTARINKYNLLLSSGSIASSHEYMRFFFAFSKA